MSVVPSQDQVMAQLRIVIPALGTIVTAVGVSSTSVNNLTQIALASVGPISYVVCGIWSIIVNTQKAKVLAVKEMPGVEHIEVNAKANQTLASLAIDPTVDKIAAPAAVIDQVTAIAKGTSS